MTKTLVYSAKVSSKVKSSGGNYEIGSFQVGDACGNPFKVGERIITPGERYGTVSSVRGKKITITWDNGLSAEYTPKQLQAWNYRKSREDKETYSVGQRVKIANHKEKYYSDWDWGIITNISSKKIDVKMGNKFIIAVDIADIKPDTEQFWRSASGLHPVPSSLGISENDPRFIRCDILPIEEQIKLCEERISRQQWRIDDLMQNCQHKKNRDKAIDIAKSHIQEENLRIKVLKSRLESAQAIAPQFLIDKFLKENHSIECTQQLKIGDRVRILKTRTKNLEGWVGYEATVTAINNETISVLAGEGREKKHLTLKHGWYEVIPENFLEEKPQPSQLPQQPKSSKQKGCLYKYLENKKLKDGTIASYPRVIGHREPDNPNHWRWGFNWEEKIDGEWKGRSIGSVPVGAIPLIEDMRKRNIPLEEIIDFIKRSKKRKVGDVAFSDPNFSRPKKS